MQVIAVGVVNSPKWSDVHLFFPFCHVANQQLATSFSELIKCANSVLHFTPLESVPGVIRRSERTLSATLTVFLLIATWRD